MRKYGEMTFSRFLIVGATNTVVTYILYLGLLSIIPYVWAYSVTFFFGIFLGYVLNSFWVFKTPPNLRSAASYPVVYGVNYLIGVGALWVLVERINLQVEIAPLVVVAVSTPIMYFIARSIFRGKASHEKVIN